MERESARDGENERGTEEESHGTREKNDRKEEGEEGGKRESEKEKEREGKEKQKGKGDVLRHEDQKSFILISGACKEKQEGCSLLACACIYIRDDAFPQKDLNCEDATNEATPSPHS